MNRVIIASTNVGKVFEITKILSGLDIEGVMFESVASYKIAEPEEPYESFIENAKHKAKYYGDLLNKVTIADDSGLCIEVLGGFPGVGTKDFLVESGSLNNAFFRLEKKLCGKKNTNAYFNVALAVYFPKTSQFITNEDKKHGSISFPARGRDGFGFDPIFIPSSYNKTLAELGNDVKSKIGHRAKALNGLAAKLKMRGEFSQYFKVG